MRHTGTQTLQTKRLTLRRFVCEDAEAMYKNWASDPEVTRFLSWPPHQNAEVTRAVVADWVRSYEDPSYYHWVIVLSSSQTPVGTISVVKQDETIEMLEIGYCLGQQWWHQGIMSEALSAVLKECFEHIGANRVQARHDPENPHSGMVMKKCGMHYEGILRQTMRSNRGITDCAVYSMLRSEWPGCTK